MGAALNNFMNKFNDSKVLPAGKTFKIKVTDTEAAAAAREYLEEYNEQVRQLIQNSAGMSINVENPEIRFGNDEISMAARGRKGFLKVNSSVNAEVMKGRQS